MTAGHLQIVSATPHEDYVDITFNGPIDPASFTTDDVTILPHQGVALQSLAQLGTASQDVAVAGNRAYVADNTGITILDISNSAEPRQLGHYDTVGTPWRVKVVGDRAFVACGNSGLQIINVANSAAPILQGSSATTAFILDVAVTGDLACVLSPESGLQVFDVSNPGAPRLLGSYSLPTTASRLTVAGDLVYVADDSSGVQILSLADPTAPALVGSYQTPGSALSISVVGDLACVAEGNAGLQILNIANPAAPSLVASYATTGYALEVNLEGDRAYVTDDTGHCLQILSLADPATPTLLGTYNASRVDRGVRVVGDLAFLPNFDLGLQIVNVADPTATSLVGSYTTPDFANSMAVVGDLAYVTSNAGLQIFNLADPSVPRLVGTCPLTSPSIVRVQGNFAYVACNDSTLQIVNLADPTAPSLVGSCSLSNYPVALSVEGNLACLIGVDMTLQVVSLADPTAPSVVGSYSLPDYAAGVDVKGGVAYVACSNSTLQIVSLADPNAPSLMGSYSLPAYAEGVTVAGDLAYVACSSAGVVILNIADPTAPSLVATYNTPGFAADVRVMGDLAYVADDNGLLILNVANPAAPSLLQRYATGDVQVTKVIAAGDRVYLPKLFEVEVFRNPSAVVSITQVDETTYRLGFTNPLANDGYTLTIGSQIADTEGALLDQDQDGQGGERSDDAFHAAWWSGQCPSVQLQISADAVTEHRPAGTVVGSFSSSVADLNSTFRYRLVSGAGDTDNASFTIDASGRLVTAASFDRQTQSSYSIRVAATDDYGLSYEQAFTITAVAPLQIVASSAEAGYVDVTFNRPIDPSTFTANDVSLLPNGNLTLQAWRDLCGEVWDVAVAGNYAYAATPDGLMVLDVSNPASMHWVADVNLDGSNGGQVAVQGDLLYVAVLNRGLRIYNIADPAAPSLVAACDGCNWANELVVKGDLAFIADRFSGVQIYNVADPTAPYLLSTYSTPDLALGVTIVGNRAYVADNGAGMLILDISDPTAPSLLGSYDTPDSMRAISVVGDLAYLVDVGKLLVLNIADPTAPSLIGSTTTYAGSYAISVVGDLAYVTDSYGLLVFNIADPTVPVQVGRCYTIQHSSTASIPGDHLLTLVGDRAYVMNGTGLQIISLADPILPTLVGLYDAPSSANNVCVVGNTLYVATQNQGLQIFDFADPAAPRWLGGYSSGSSDVVTVGNLAYVTSGSSLYILDITNPASTIRLSRYRTPGYYPTSLSVSGDLAYIAYGDGGVRIVNFANPAAPVLLSTYDTPGYAQGVSLEGNRLYVADGDSLLILDVSDPAAPSLVARCAMPNGANAVEVSGDLAYVTGYGGFEVYDLRDLAAPTLLATYSTPETPTGIFVAGDRIYVSLGTGLQILHNLTVVDSVTQVGQATYRLHLGTPLPEGYTLTISPQIADSDGLQLDQDQDGVAGEYPDDALRVTYASGNSRPRDLSLSSSGIAENPPLGTVVGTFSTTDPDVGDTFAYSLVAGEGDSDNGAFTIDAEGHLRTNATFDFEAKAVYSIRVCTTDAAGASFAKAFTISVTDLDEPPTDIVLSGLTVAGQSPSGTVVGGFSASDPDAGDSFTYTLVPRQWRRGQQLVHDRCPGTVADGGQPRRRNAEFLLDPGPRHRRRRRVS